jgi:hypothetical protein
MGIFVDEKKTFEIIVKYVFDKDGDVHVVTDQDIENISKTEEEKNKMKDRLTHASDVPFNVPVDVSNFSSEDVRQASFNFKKPSFDDVPVILSSIASITPEGAISPGDIFHFNNKKLKLLFVDGKAQDEDGKEVEVNIANIGYISPILGSAMATRMSEQISI